MNEYSVRVLTGKPERLFQFLAESGMAVVGCDGCFLYILQGEAGGFYTMSHRPGSECYACKYYPDDRALRQAAGKAQLLLHVDGVLRHQIDVVIRDLEKEIAERFGLRESAVSSAAVKRREVRPW